jgi:adenosylmethionine---8-amino-7-oxononanoate aminotransferase
MSHADGPFGATVGSRAYSADEQSLLLLDQAHAWHPYTQHQGMALPLPIARADGSWLYETNGRPFSMRSRSWWVTTHGHCHPAIATAIAEQARTLDQVIFAGLHARARRPSSRLRSCSAPTWSHACLLQRQRVDGGRGGDQAVAAVVRQSRHTATPGGGARSRVSRRYVRRDGRGRARRLHDTMYEPLLFEVARLPDPSEGDTLARRSTP